MKREIVETYDHRLSENLAGMYTAFSTHNSQELERRLSPIIHVRNLTNWVKSSLIKSFASPGARVLDLGCGHGGDLKKYNALNIGYYVGVGMYLSLSTLSSSLPCRSFI